MEQKHVLFRFFSEKDYLEQFLNGSIYMNSMHYFWDENNLADAVRRKREIIAKNPCLNLDKIRVPLSSEAPRGQMDRMEGTIATTDNFKIGFPEDFARVQPTDVLLRAVGYQYCNICCFYRYDVGSMHNGVSDEIKGFGKYVAVIKNETEFIRRVEEAVRKQGYHFVCGNVDYQPNKKLGKPVDLGHHMILKADMRVDIFAGAYKDILLEKRDAFCKSNTYKNQNEWRIVLYRGELSTEAYKLELGDISDIVTWVSTDKMDKLFFEKIEKSLERRIEDITEPLAEKNSGTCFTVWGIIRRKCLRRSGDSDRADKGVELCAE